MAYSADPDQLTSSTDLALQFAKARPIRVQQDQGQSQNITLIPVLENLLYFILRFYRIC